MTDDMQRFLENVRQFFGRTAWTHKTQEIERESWASKAYLVRWGIILSSTATLALASISQLQFSAPWYLSPSNWTIAIGAVTFLIPLYDGMVNPERQENLHRQAAKELFCIRDELQLLIENALNGEPLEKLRSERRRLLEARNMLFKWCPDTGKDAYGRATEALKINEELTLHDDEIDQFLPTSLRAQTRYGHDTLPLGVEPVLPDQITRTENEKTGRR